MGRTPLAKLTRPKLHNVCMRERLFARLDEGRTRSAIWVVGPPGAGKTTLVASYLEARKLNGIWYQIDASDHDVSTFFYYLGLAAGSPGGKRSGKLPLLTPEYLANLPGFARHYFRQLYGQLKTPAVFTLDNYHELPVESAFHEVLEQALSEVPDGITLIIVSRTDPPPECARAEALERMTRLEWDTLRLTLEETAAIAALRHEVDEPTLRLLHERCDGWAAGLTLTLEGLKRLGDPQTDIEGEALESVFNYFAGQIMKVAAPQTEEFLIKTALLPRMTAAMAEQLSGNANAPGLLEYFYRRRLFTDRRGTTYQYHDLFRAFLLQQFKQIYTEAGQNRLRRQAGRLLEDAQQFEDASRLYRLAQDWEGVTRLILGQAAKLLEQGRGETLREWIRMLPPSLPEQLPWLDYWRGASLIQVEPDAARAPLTRAFVRFEKEQDTLGRILACTGMILTYYVEFANMTPIDPWIDALLALLDAEPDFPSPAVELRVNAVLVFALTFRRPDPEPLQKRVAKTTTLLAADISANDKVVAAIFLLAYLYRVGTVEQAARHIRQLQPVVDLDKVSPVNKALWLRSVGYFSWYAGDTARAEKALRSALETAASNAVALSSIHGLSFWALAACALDHGDFSLAESYCDKAAAFCQPRPLDRFFEARLKAMLASHRRDWGRAVRYAEWALAAASESGVVHLQFLGKVALANALIDSARHADAMQVVSQARILIARTAFAPYECQTNLVQAYAALRQGDTARCHERLRAAFSGANPEEYAAYHCVRYHPELLSSLFAEALAAEIDTDYVRYLIHRLDVLPPGPEAVHWPWPLRIRTLGHFELLHDGRPLEFSRKVPKKPLQLLKATIAFGSTEVPEQRLIDALWPDEVGDRAYSAFTMALNRLRKLLGVADAIQHRGGRLTIDRRRCWLDVAAFERLMEPSVNADVAEPHNGTRRALDLYRGSFLEDEGEAPWAARARERFRRMFVQGLSVSAQWLEQTHQYDAAIALYRRGVEADDLEEQFYRGLMRCHGKTGRRAEAMNVYRRLRQTLSITLGIAPGPTTEELANQVQQGLNSV